MHESVYQLMGVLVKLSYKKFATCSTTKPGTIMLWKLMSSRELRNYFDQNILDVGYNHYNVLKVSVWLVFFTDEDSGNGSKHLK